MGDVAGNVIESMLWLAEKELPQDEGEARPEVLLGLSLSTCALSLAVAQMGSEAELNALIRGRDNGLLVRPLREYSGDHLPMYLRDLEALSRDLDTFFPEGHSPKDPSSEDV